MISEEARELATWLAKVSEKYNKPILLVVNAFQEALGVHNDIHLAKVNVVAELSE